MHLPTLTRLQQEVLLLVMQGCSNQQIALRLGTTPGAVGMQIGRIIEHLGLRCRADIAAWAVEQLDVAAAGWEAHPLSTQSRLDRSW
jgi:DNA-binding CsgD family transcriptional regulator